MTSMAMNKTQQSNLKELIAKGKEQGYLTYAEVNDHLPDGIVDPEQVEEIIAMIGDMGINVSEVAPDSDTLSINDNSSSTDDEAADEAAAVLATVDGEFGRTTDPVRMYMREMGTVELLTREGEIEIAKRIEGGLRAVLGALGTYPESINMLLEKYQLVQEEQCRLSECIINFMEKDDTIRVAAPAGEKDEDAPENTGPDLEEVKRRVTAMSKEYAKALKMIDASGGLQDDAAQEQMKKVAEIFLEFKYAPLFIIGLVTGLRGQVDRVRSLERQIRDICVKTCGMPRMKFIQTFPGRETDEAYLDDILKEGKDAAWVEKVEAQRAEIEMLQTRISQIGVAAMLPINDLKEINRERDGRSKPAFGNFYRKEVHQPRLAVLRFNSRRQHRLDEGC